MDDGPDDDDPRLGPPLPPDDRLWRHPSEVGAAAAFAAAAPPKRSRAVPWVTAGIAAMVGTGVTLVVVGLTGGFGERVVSRDVGVEQVAVSPGVTLPVNLGPGSEGVGRVADEVNPAIVRLSVDTEGDGEDPRTGSGVLFRDNGYLLTSADVVGSDGTVDVVLASGQTFTGERVGSDPLTDVAVVKVEGEDLPTAVMGTAEALAVGEPAIVVGSPVDPRGGPSLTVGIVSALGRTITEGSGNDTRALHDMIQTDAPVAPGSSGGALVDRRGTVIGITTSVGAGDQESEGLGFATPIDVARAVANDIIIVGHARHPWLGIEGADVDAAAAEDLGVPGGAVVRDVAGGSPADMAGLAEDDVITSLAGVGVASMADLVVELRRHDPGEAIPIDYLRDGDEAHCTALLAERPG